jgi:hypothetical protein
MNQTTPAEDTGTLLQPAPSSAQRTHDICDRGALRAQRVDAIQLGLEQIALGVDDFELTGKTVIETNTR